VLRLIAIKQVGSDGRRRRCDARCWKAKGKRCTCLCGGRNHGGRGPGAGKEAFEDLARRRQLRMKEVTHAEGAR